MSEIIIRTITAFVLGSIFWLSFIYLPVWVFSIILLAILAQIILFEWTKLFNLHKLTFWLVMPLYPILPFVLLIALNQQEGYRPLLFILFVLVSSHDAGSFIAGKLIGKHKILPRVSPRKTWEGFVGGWLFATTGLTWLLWELHSLIPWWQIILFSTTICSLSLAGDLFESWLKRRAHVKDSGTILPGHGGFLDRFDGILFTAFFFYIFKDQLLHLFNL